jgi:putative ABC transport system ATP-binding protein
MISIKGLGRVYSSGDTQVAALNDVDLDIEQGEFIAIAGPSGSGKTTLLNIIGCIDSADKGTVSIDDVDVTAIEHGKLAGFRREKLGFIFQSFNLIPVLSAYENVALVLSLLEVPDDEIRQRTYKLLEEVGLKGLEDRRPAKLSGGQQQRVAIARALIKQPSIVLADEPTANLDSKNGADVLNLMKEMNKKYQTTFIFSTHDQMVMDYASRLVQLHDGKIQSDDRR